jgi:hypothetical protein
LYFDRFSNGNPGVPLDDEAGFPPRTYPKFN